MSKVCYFNASWMNHPDYCEWLLKEGNHRAKCRICQKTFNVGNMGESAVKSHMRGSKHQTLAQRELSTGRSNLQITTFLDRSQARKAPSHSEGADSQVPMASTASGSIQDFVTKEDVLKAEVLWALNVIECHYSYKSCDKSGALFRRMFPDSNIAAQYKCAEKKAAYLNVFGLAPHFQTLLKQKINSKYVLLFDESLNKKNQKKQMDFFVRMWDNDEVKSRYLDSKFIGHCTAEHMVTELHSVLEGLNPRNLIQLSMDGPSVNWKFHKLVQTEMETNYGKAILDVGSCGLHILHGAFQTGVEKSGIGVSNFLSSLYALFRDSPARREDYMSVTDSTNMPLKFSRTRWLDNSPCVSRAIDIWDSVKAYVNAVLKKKITNPDNQSFKTVKEFVKCPLSLTKLQFFLSISQEITPFLTKYQTDKPMIPFVASDLAVLIQGLLERFVKHTVTSSLTTTKLSGFDVHDNSNYCELSKLDIGLAAEKSLKENTRARTVSERQVLELRIEFRSLLVNMVGKVLEKSPLKYPLARCLSCLDPRLFSEKEVAIKNMKRVLSVLTDAGWITAENGDEARRQFSRYLSDAGVRHAHFDPVTDRLDHTWHADIARNTEYSKLWTVVNQLLLLSHGQATVERGFSINKEIEVENLREESLIAQRIICDHLSVVGGVEKIEIDKKLLLSAASARHKYQLYLDGQKQSKASETTLRSKRKLEEQIGDLKSKHKRLTLDISSMFKSADELSMKAEKEGNLTYISQSNSLRASAKQKEQELSDVQGQLDINMQQLRSL